jgi:hypothetical protein
LRKHGGKEMGILRVIWAFVRAFFVGRGALACPGPGKLMVAVRVSSESHRYAMEMTVTERETR